jgi:transcriptional regulator with XRE-family HTH domain
LAEQLGTTGTTIYRWERGETWPDPEDLEAIADIFKITIGDLLAYDLKKADAKASLAQAPTILDRIAKLLRDLPSEVQEAILRVVEGYHQMWLAKSAPTKPRSSRVKSGR